MHKVSIRFKDSRVKYSFSFAEKQMVLNFKRKVESIRRKGVNKEFEGIAYCDTICELMCLNNELYQGEFCKQSFGYGGE